MSVEAEDDEIEASRAPLIAHLTELRDRLIKALAALIVCVIVCFIFATELYDILTAPLRDALIARGLETRLIYTGLQEKFFTDMRLSLFGGFFIAFPLIAMQLWRFIAPGLYQNEKQAFWPFPFKRRDRFHQCTGVRMAGGAEQLLHLSMLNNLTTIHHHDAVSDARDDAKVMGDPDDPHAQIPTKVFHQLQNLCLDSDCLLYTSPSPRD